LNSEIVNNQADWNQVNKLYNEL